MVGRLRTHDGRAVGALVIGLLLLTALSWLRWGVPSFDTGLDLTVADRIARQDAVPYRDARYFYGPAGLYALALAFKVLGSSLAVAFAFGYAVTVAVISSFYVLCRQWLAPLGAALTTGLLLSIAFSGTFFDYVLPHTNAGVVGCLFLILQVLALARGRELWGGLAAGILLLTRVEFAAFAAVVVAGYALGHLRESGLRRALRAAVVAGLPALVVAAVVYAPLVWAAGLDRVLFENLVPVDFARFGGGKLQSGWAPFTLDSFVATAARGLLVGLPVAGLVAALSRRRAGRGPAAVLPLLLALGVIVAGGALWHFSGVFAHARAQVTDEAGNLLIAMSWLPVPALAALAWAAPRARRNGSAPGIGWPADLALLAGAAAAGLRGYNEFTPDSYAPYWAALPVLVAGIALDRVGRRWPAGRPVALAALLGATLALSLHAYVGLMRDDVARVDTPRGQYRWYGDGGRALEQTTRYAASRLSGTEPMLVFPDDPGIYFLTGHPSALYESTFLPGTLDTAQDERKAIRRLNRRTPKVVVIGAQEMQNFGFPVFGKDYNRLLGAWVRRHYRPTRRFGDVSRPTRDNLPARAFTVLEPR